MAPLHEKTIAKMVRKARNDLGLTQEQLAERLDMQEPTVRAIEAGRRSVSLKTLLKLAEKLQTTVGVLVGEEKEQLRSVQAEAAKLVGDLDGPWQHSALRILRELHDRVVSTKRRPSR